MVRVHPPLYEKRCGSAVERSALDREMWVRLLPPLPAAIGVMAAHLSYKQKAMVRFHHSRPIAGGRRFESGQADFGWPVAQSGRAPAHRAVEQSGCARLSGGQEIAGSNPARPTNAPLSSNGQDGWFSASRSRFDSGQGYEREPGHGPTWAGQCRRRVVGHRGSPSWPKRCDEV